jgi:hypothetical protein
VPIVVAPEFFSGIHRASEASGPEGKLNIARRSRGMGGLKQNRPPMTLLYIFSTLNERGLPLSVANINPIDIKLKRERGNQTQNKEAYQTFYEQNNYK